MPLKPLADIIELLKKLRHQTLKRRQVPALLIGRSSVNGTRSASPCNNILSLGIHEILAVKLAFSRGRVAAERNAGRRIIAHVPEHHRLHVDCRSPFIRNLLYAAVLDSTSAVPTCENRAHSAPQLFPGVIGKGLAKVFFDKILEPDDQLFQILNA